MKCRHLPGTEVTYCTLCDIGPYKGHWEATLEDHIPDSRAESQAGAPSGEAMEGMAQEEGA